MGIPLGGAVALTIFRCNGTLLLFFPDFDGAPIDRDS